MDKFKKIKKGKIIGLLFLLGVLLVWEYGLLEKEQTDRAKATQAAAEDAPSSLQEEKEKSPTQTPAPKEESKETSAKETETINMRVLLMDTDYQSYYHPSVTLRIDGKKQTYQSDSPALQSGSVRIEKPAEGKIQVLSIERTQGNPSYGGVLEIIRRPEGLLLINEIPLEEYLYAVVPSEMPASYEPEALKAQAVCARTYAWRQYLDQKLAAYDAYVDDSVSFQVYNNFAGDAASKQAVDETKGEILCQDGEPIQAYYFSTSAGATSTDEVWEVEEEAPYLQSVACMYDAEEPWSQWEIFFPIERLNARISARFGNIGELSSLEIVSTSAGGAVKELRVLTDKTSLTVHNEYEIRSLFSPGDLAIIKKDGSESTGNRLLPSAYFHLDSIYEKEKLAGYRFLGGGYGHGVGMSQNGANHMAMAGSVYQEILQYFFKDISIESYVK